MFYNSVLFFVQMISTKAPSSHWKPIVPTPCRDFPNGFGAQWQSNGPIHFSRFIQRWGREIFKVIERHGLVIFPHALHDGSEPEIPIRSTHFGFHVDRGNHEIPLKWHVSHLRLNPDTPDRDPTIFAPKRCLIKAVRAVNPHFVDASDIDIETHLHCGTPYELDRYTAASRVCYSHDWARHPTASVLYFADQHPLASRVLHARFNPPGITQGVARLISTQMPEDRFLS